MTGASPKSVLITDDFMPNRRILRQALSSTGLEILEAENGLQTLDMALELVPDVILLDVKMPDMDGYEVCRRLKDDPKTYGIPVLLVTAFAEEEDRILGVQAGANDFVAKPVDTPDLISRIRTALTHREEKDRLQIEIDALKEQETQRNNMIQFAVNDLNREISDLHQSLNSTLSRLTGPELREERRDLLVTQDRLVNLLSSTDHLLELRRLETHQSPFDCEGCDLLDALDEVLEVLNLDPGKNGFDVRISSEEAMVLADPDILPKVVRNLITASREVIPEVATQTIQVETGTDTSLFVRLTISVEGDGIVHSHHRDALARLEKLDSAHACTSSFELGLAFSKMAIESQGGVLDLAMASDHKITVEVALPAYSAAQATNVISFPAPLQVVSEKQGMH